MLIQPNKAELGDTRLNAEEGLAKIKEENLRQAAANKIADQDLLEDTKAALGMPMQPSDLILKLQKLNPSILIQKGGVKNAVAVRFPKFDSETGKVEQTYITGFYMDAPLPEFSSVVVDRRGLPFRELRGWRSVVLALVNAGALTLKQVDLSFGKPTGQRSVLWNRSNQARGRN